jgi:hypothetical protein
MDPCRVCGHETERRFDAEILGRHRVGYHECPACGFLQTDAPHWLGEAYAESINLQDTGLVARNVAFANDASVLLYCFFDRGAKYVDWAGGYGLFTRLMRDAGFDFRSFDPNTPNLLAKGFEARPDEEGVELVTSFESFEHFVRPGEEIGKMLALSRNLLFSTVLLPSPVPKPGAWWYYGLEHGQHVSFYAPRTLAHLAARYGLHLFTWGKLHLLTEKPIAPWRLRLAWKLRRRLQRRLRERMTSRTQADHDLLARGAGPGR